MLSTVAIFMRQIGLPVSAQQIAVENSLDSAQLTTVNRKNGRAQGEGDRKFTPSPLPPNHPSWITSLLQPLQVTQLLKTGIFR